MGAATAQPLAAAVSARAESTASVVAAAERGPQMTAPRIEWLETRALPVVVDAAAAAVAAAGTAAAAWCCSWSGRGCCDGRDC